MAESGKTHRVYITTGASANTVLVGELSSNWTLNKNIIDISNKDSSWFEGLAGNASWEASASFTYLKGTNQETLVSNSIAGTKFSIFIGEVLSSSRSTGVYGEVYVASVGQTNEDNGVVTRDISFTGTGALTPLVAATTTVAPTTTTAG